MAHVHLERHSILAGSVLVEGGAVVVDRLLVRTTGAGHANVAAVPAHGGQVLCPIDKEAPVGEAVDGGRAGAARGELLLLRPSVEGELVFDRACRQVERGLPNAIAVAVVQRVAGAAPSVEGAVHVDHAVRGTIEVGHVHPEGHGEQAGAVVVGGVLVVVDGSGVRATEGVGGLLFTGVATAVRVGGRGTGRRHAVGVRGRVRHGRAGQPALGIVHEVLLGSPVVDHVLVLDIPGRNANVDAVHAVAIRIGQGVVRLGAAPSAPGTGDVNRGEGLLGTVHVHREGGRGGQAVAVAVEVGRSVGTGSIVIRGLAVVVAGGLIRASIHRARDLGEAERRFDQLGLVTLRENLDEELTAHFTGCRQLGEQDLLVVAGDAVGAAGQDVPSPSNRRADVDVAAGSETELPRIHIRIDEHGHFRLASTEVGLLFDADGHPAVILGSLETRQRVEERVNRGRRRAAQRVLVEGRRGVEEQRRVLIADRRRHEVVGVGRVHIHAIRGHSAHAIRGEGLHRKAEALGVSSVLETGVLSGC